MRRSKKVRILILFLSALLFLSMMTLYTDVLSLPNRHLFHQKKLNTVIEGNIHEKKSNLQKYDYAVKSQLVVSNDKYIMRIEALRINKLFKILQEKEKSYAPILERLKLISFENIVNKNTNEKFLAVNNKNNVIITDDFVQFLNDQSDLNSYTNKRNIIERAKITKVIH